MNSCTVQNRIGRSEYFPGRKASVRRDGKSLNFKEKRLREGADSE